MKLNKARTEEYQELLDMREQLGLPQLLNVKQRECLQCETIFTSPSNSNRICPECIPIGEESMTWLYSEVSPSKETMKKRKLRSKK